MSAQPSEDGVDGVPSADGMIPVRASTLDFLWSQFEGRAAVDRRLDEALRYVDHLLTEKQRLERRRIVIAALAAARIARPLLRLLRRLRRIVRRDRPVGQRDRSDSAADLAVTLERAEATASTGDLIGAAVLWREVAATQHPKFASIARTALFLSEPPRPTTTYGHHGTDLDPLASELIVYTAVTGGEDLVWVPGLLPSSARSVAFTDRTVEAPPEIELIRPPYLAESPRKVARWLKTHPHVLFPHARYVLWMDANLTAVQPIEEIVRGFCDSGAAVGFILHPDRTTVEEEVAKCMEVGKAPAVELVSYLRRRHLEGRGPLLETNVVLYDLAHVGLAQFLSDWWREIDGGTIRDQVSLPFVLRAANIDFHPLLGPDRGARGDRRFGYSPHGSALVAPLGRKFGHVVRRSPDGETVGHVLPHVSVADAPHSVDVVIPVHDALNHLQRCVRSVLPALEDPTVRLIISDDGSERSTADWIRDFADSNESVTVQRSNHSTGFAAASNRGARTGDGDLLLVLNSDTELPPGWLERVRRHFGCDQLALLSPLSNAAESQSVPLRSLENDETRRAGSPVNPLPAGFDLESFDGLIRDLFSRRLLFAPTVHGFCMAIRRTAFESVGGFDASAFPRGFGEEVDLAFRLADEGWLSAIALDLYVWHAKSGSFDPEERRVLDTAGAAVLRRRHGGRLDAAVKALHHSEDLETVRRTIATACAQ